MAIQLVDEHPKDTSYIEYASQGNWLTYNFVGYRIKSVTTLNVEYGFEAYDAKLRRWKRGTPSYLKEHFPDSSVLRVYTYLIDKQGRNRGLPDKRLEETLWCVPRPLASLIEQCISKGQH